MNKKRLSVVMAGAMLASSVAPVMAAEATTEATKVSANELGLLQEEVRSLVESARFADDALNSPTTTPASPNVRKQSIYEVVINKSTQTLLLTSTDTKDWQKVFNGLRVGDTVKVYDRGSKEVNGKYYHYESSSDVKRYKESELGDLATKLDALKSQTGVIKAAYVNPHDPKEVIVELNDDKNVPGQESVKMMSIKEGDQKLVMDSNAPKYWTNKEHTTSATLTDSIVPENFFGFVKDEEIVTATTAIPGKLVKDYVITPGGYNFDVADLYDGLFLTEKGNEFFGMLKDNVAAGREAKIVINSDGRNHYTVRSTATENEVKTAENTIKGKLKEFNGVYRFEIEIAPTDSKDEFKKATYTVSGKDKDEVARLASWMIRPQARVDKFEGSNRYETAALIAREYAGLTRASVHDRIKPIAKDTDVNIVLVNGDALVDGLSAAPLAAAKANTVVRYGKTTEVSAPVLLTEAGKLPKETKAYLREVLSNIAVGDLPKVTINLVGGETVLTKDLERELKAIGYHGFKVERFGGDNREETSLEVAKEIGTDRAFVVGGEGEADAMSIASVAATQQTPIIVAKKGGISEDGIYEIRDRHVTIVGGKTVVTTAEEKEIRTEAKSVNRIDGANRKATNAAVIEKYYRTTGNAGFANAVGSAKNVIVAKDGQRRKIDLVDALAAANMASEKKAPIVLATNKLSKEQEAVINSHAKDAYGLFQVGGQVERPVMKKIAIMLNLTNRGTK